MSKYFRANPCYAAELLAEVRRSGSQAELAILLRQLAIALVAIDHTSTISEE